MFLITVDCSPTTAWSGWLQLGRVEHCPHTMGAPPPPNSIVNLNVPPPMWWCITGRFFSASCLQTLTARINLSNTPFEREILRHQYSIATIRKTNANHNIDVWRHPSPTFSTFGHSKSHPDYVHIRFACKLQLKRSTVNHVKDSNFSVCKRLL